MINARKSADFWKHIDGIFNGPSNYAQIEVEVFYLLIDYVLEADVKSPVHDEEGRYIFAETLGVIVDGDGHVEEWSHNSIHGNDIVGDVNGIFVSIIEVSMMLI